MVKPNVAIPATGYVPILKGKMAELGAIETCTSNLLVPLVEVTAPENAGKPLTKAWQHADDVIWVHALNFTDVEEAEFAQIVEDLFAELRPDILAVPVITVSEGPDTLAAIRRVIEADSRGVVLRLDVEDVLDTASDTNADIASTLQQLGLGPQGVDLVIDAGLIEGAVTVQAAVAEQCLRRIRDMDDWRSVVVAFSAFPIPLSAVVPVSSVRAVPRSDAAAFVRTRALTERQIIFGDYTLGSPNYDSVPFTPIPNIRYTSGPEWVIHRAAERKGPGPQFRQLAKDIVAAAYFAGAAFSPGDRQIAEVASEASGPGNPTTHLRAGISRHVHVVLERLSTLGEP